MNKSTNNSLTCKEDAKNLIELSKKFENNLVLGPDGFMHEIKTDSTKSEWIGIGRAKRMLHRCKNCARTRFMFPSVYNVLRGKLCQKCTLIKRNKSEEMRIAVSNSKRGENNHFYGLVGEKNPANRSEVRKKLKEYQNIPSVKERKRKLYVERMNIFGHKGGQFFNKNACRFMDVWGEEHGYEFQHAMNGGEFYVEGYWVDGYDKEKNVIFEYDEKRHHFHKKLGASRTKKDLTRMCRIQSALKCKFIRYNEPTNTIETYEYTR